jgi:acetolactate synthase I/II/III large subunit
MPKAKSKMTSARLLVQCLETEGVKYIFGVPGEENLALLDAIRASKKIKFIVTRHEQAAAFMAATMGRHTGKVSVALSTLGPGATNLVTGVAYAQLGGMPLMVITGQKPIKKSKQGRFQIIDVVAMMKPITKMTTTIVSAEQVPAIVRNAVASAEGERPGAVHIELPEDIAEEETDLAPIVPKVASAGVASYEAVAEAVAMIERASHPVLLLATGANNEPARKPIQDFIDKTGIPFVSAQTGKGAVDETQDSYLGTTALSKNDYAHKALQHADLIIAIGHDVMHPPPTLMPASSTQKIIHINSTPAVVDRVYAPTTEVIGEITHTMKMIGALIKPKKGRRQGGASGVSWNFNTFKKIKKGLEEALALKSDSSAFPLAPQRIVADIRSALPEDGVLCLDNGMYKLWVARNYKAHLPKTLLLDNALATMGAGLPSGIATKLLYPKRKVVVLTGDGGFMMCSAELETATRLGLDLVVIIVNDSGYGMIKWKQSKMRFPDFGLSFTNPNFIKFAESFGAKGHRVSGAEEFKSILEKALRNGGVQVIECPIDYRENKLFSK